MLTQISIEEVQIGQRDIQKVIKDHREEDSRAHTQNLQEHRDTKARMSESGKYS
jgi:hypothetical protein